MVLSSFSPLFLLWAIRGTKVIPTQWFVTLCALCIVMPNVIMWLRIRTATKTGDRRSLVVGSATDQDKGLLAYLFAVLLPLYSEEIGTWRAFAAICVALFFIILLFMHLNLHYMNVLFTFRGYHVFSVDPPKDPRTVTGRRVFVVITPRKSVVSGDRLRVYRLSNSVYFERKNDSCI